MSANTSSAARWTAAAFAAAWVAGWVAYGTLAEPRVSLTYAIPGPGQPPEKVSRCGEGDARQQTSVTVGVREVPTTLCFTARRSGDGPWQVPYAVAPVDETQASPESPTTADREDAEGADAFLAEVDAAEQAGQRPGYLMDAPDSSNVVAYAASAARGFTLPGVAIQEADALIRRARVDRWKNVAFGVLAGLVAAWLLAFAPVFPRTPGDRRAGSDDRR